MFVPKVCSVLESLEQEYKREEDWCGGADKLGPNCETDHVTPMISKHLEQKEAFLKVEHVSVRPLWAASGNLLAYKTDIYNADVASHSDSQKSRLSDVVYLLFFCDFSELALF